MDELITHHNGKRQRWVSPDALMLRSVLSLIVEAPLNAYVDSLRKIMSPSKAIDVGACIGSISWLLDYLFPGIEIHAYEPSKENYACLEENTQSLNIYRYNYGLSDKEGEMTLAMPTVEQKQYMNYFKGDNVGIMSVYGDSEYRRQPIEVKVLDDLHNEADIIKVDAEGHDYQIMLGARNIVMNSRPLLMLEFVPANFKLSGNKLEDYLSLLFEEYRYVPVGGTWGNSFWLPHERAPEQYKSARFRFREKEGEYTSGYEIIMEEHK